MLHLQSLQFWEYMYYHLTLLHGDISNTDLVLRIHVLPLDLIAWWPQWPQYVMFYPAILVLNRCCVWDNFFILTLIFIIPVKTDIYSNTHLNYYKCKRCAIDWFDRNMCVCFHVLYHECFRIWSCRRLFNVNIYMAVFVEINWPVA